MATGSRKPSNERQIHAELITRPETIRTGSFYVMMNQPPHRTSLTWPGAAKTIPEEDLLSVLERLEPHTRRRLTELARAIGRGDVSTLVWLIESSFGAMIGSGAAEPVPPSHSSIEECT